ncbi:MAG TPA: cytochrome c biogenesis protein DipZ [Solirubrobacteraceae bacterium]
MLLLAFALLAGAGTALSPCVLPILPAVLSAGATGGPRRPLGVVLGLAATFALTVAGVAELVVGTGVGQAVLRDVAVAVVALAGLVLLVPRLGERVEHALAPASRLGPRSRGRGFWSGLGVGAALGLLYVPCAGPILASVISVGAASSATVPIALAYAAGSALVLFALALGGRRIAAHLRGPAVRTALGAVLVATALVLATNTDQRFEAMLAAHLPSALVDPTGGLERSHAVQRRLAALGHAPRFKPMASHGADLPDLGPAPNFRGTQRWFNSPPLSLAALRGHVVLVDFWTYTCINCLRTLPYLKAWYAKYRADGFVVVGVHTPEFGFEHDAGNVRDAVKRFGIRYPVVQDNKYSTWFAWGNQAWPSEYLIDARGHVREAREGEGGYADTERSIRALLAAAGGRRLGGEADVGPVTTPSTVETPETYLGAARAEGWVLPPHQGLLTFPATAGDPPLNHFAYAGTWRIGAQPALAVRDAVIKAHVVGRAVYVVLGSAGGRPRTVTVLLDGKPIPMAMAGADVRDGRIVVRRQRLYSVAAFGARPREHVLTLQFAPGVTGYSFTFG